MSGSRESNGRQHHESSVLITRTKKVGKNEAGNNVFRDSEGRIFHTIKKNPLDQVFVARTLKGIVPVSDVVYDTRTRNFLSCELPLAQEGKVYSAYEKNADYVLLRAVLSSDDHDPIGQHNVLFTEHDAAWYDFESVATTFWSSNANFMANRELSALSKESLKVLRSKALNLRERFLGSEGLQFLTAVITSIVELGQKKRLKKPLTFGVFDRARGKDKTEKIMRIQSELIRRLDILIAMADFYEERR